MGTIQKLQDELQKVWTDELYSKEFKGRKSDYKDFDHALKHIRKAAQALENLTEEADHTGEVITPDIHVFRATLRKYIADVLISAIRLANVAPGGNIDLERAVLERIERKMGVKIAV